jgi:uncharacterized protein YbjQ (UPF0145 family)
MKSLTSLAAAAAILTIAASPAHARDDRLMFPVAGGMEKGKTTKDRIDPDIKVYFGKQRTPPVEKKMGEFSSSRKTNATNKTDQEACEISFVSAIVSLQQRARREGGDALVGVHSIYKNEVRESDSEYMCGAGTFAAGVALRGTVVKLKEVKAVKTTAKGK